MWRDPLVALFLESITTRGLAEGIQQTKNKFLGRGAEWWVKQKRLASKTDIRISHGVVKIILRDPDNVQLRTSTSSLCTVRSHQRLYISPTRDEIFGSKELDDNSCKTSCSCSQWNDAPRTSMTASSSASRDENHDRTRDHAVPLVPVDPSETPPRPFLFMCHTCFTAIS